MEYPQNSPGTGAEIANFQLQSLITHGSMGVVYRAFDVQSHRPVALTLLAPELSADEKTSQRFVRESRLAASVDHPNILPVYEAGEWAGVLYVATRHVPGTDLHAELDRRGTLPLPEALRILRDTAAALDAAHAAGLVHRNVRPGNILLSDDLVNGHRHVYLTGFGLDHRVPSATDVSTPGDVPGAVDYAAPEQLRGEDVDARADVYALACIAYAMLAGHPPFDRQDDPARLWAHGLEEPPRLSEECPEVPAPVEAAIIRGMAKKREDRPSSCGSLVAMMSADAAVRGASPPPGHTPGAATGTAGDVPDDGHKETRDAAGRPANRGTAVAQDPRPERQASSWNRGTAPVRRLRQVAILGAVLILLFAAGLLLPRLLSGDESVTFRADGVPYTLEVPEDWTARTHEAGDSTVSVLSEADLTTLFADEPDAPAAVSQKAIDDPASVVGLAIYHRPAGLGDQSPSARIDTAEALLPGREAYLVPRGEATVGDLGGQVMEGSMQLPANVTLQVRVLVVETDPAQLLVFFAPSSLFQERTEVFDEVSGSLRRIE